VVQYIACIATLVTGAKTRRSHACAVEEKKRRVRLRQFLPAGVLGIAGRKITK
jgi:hypothetical protein